jgi:cobalt-zinc-cadmium efflux system protein
MGHDHSHPHGSTKYDRAFLVGVGLNLGFVVVEVVFGLLAHSMALVADAGHNLSDVLGLALAWGATWLARRKPSKLRTYGFRKTTILAALANAVLLLLATGGVVWESVQRLSHPGAVEGKTVIVVAGVGVAVNGISALAFRKGGKHDLNLRGAFLHLAADAAVSFGVVITGIILIYTGWNLLDPIVSLVLSVIIVGSSWSLLRKSINLALDAVPEGIDVDAVRAYLEGLSDIVEVHDLHIWAMSTTENALTAHFVMTTGSCEPRFLGDVCKVLHDRFGIEHSTLQVEAPEAPDPCRLAPEGTL